MYHKADHPSGNPAAVIDRLAFRAALEKAKLFVVGGSSTMPILANVRLMADDGNLAIVATDLDTEMKIVIPGDVDSRLDTTLPATPLIAGAKKAKSDRVTINMLPMEPEQTDDDSGGRVLVSYDKVAFTLNALPAADFPVMEKSKGKMVRFSLPGSSFWDALDAVKGAASTEETRYYLNGIYLYPHSSEALRFVATDGHRLHCQEVAMPSGAAALPGIIMPNYVIANLHKLMSGKACPKRVDLHVADDQFTVSWDGVSLRSKTIDGTFPDYGRVIPTSNSLTAILDADELQRAIETVTVIRSGRGGALKLAFSSGACRLSFYDMEYGTAAADIAFDGDVSDMEIGFNSGHLLEVIGRACPAGGDIKLRMATSGDPVLITGEQHGWSGVLMPMRV